MRSFFDSLSHFHLRYWETPNVTLLQNISLITANVLLFIICFRSVEENEQTARLLLSFAAIFTTYLCSFLALFKPGNTTSVTEDAFKLARLVLQGWLLAQILYLCFALQRDHPFSQSTLLYCHQAIVFTLPILLLSLLRTHWNGGIKPKDTQERWGLLIAIMALFGLSTLLFDWFFLNEAMRQQLIDLVNQNMGIVNTETS